MPTFVISGRDAQNEPAAYEIEAQDENDARQQAQTLLKVIESAAPAQEAVAAGDEGTETILSSDVVAQAQTSLGGKGKTLDPNYKIKRIFRRILMTCITLIIGIIVSDVFIWRNMITPAWQHLEEASIKNNEEKLFSKEKFDLGIHEYYVSTGYFYGLAVAGVPLIWLGAWSIAKLRALKQERPARQTEDEAALTA